MFSTTITTILVLCFVFQVHASFVRLSCLLPTNTTTIDSIQFSRVDRLFVYQFMFAQVEVSATNINLSLYVRKNAPNVAGVYLCGSKLYILDPNTNQAPSTALPSKSTISKFFPFVLFTIIYDDFAHLTGWLRSFASNITSGAHLLLLTSLAFYVLLMWIILSVSQNVLKAAEMYAKVRYVLNHKQDVETFRRLCEKHVNATTTTTRTTTTTETSTQKLASH